jgi:predicted oxidoreductase
MRMTLPLAQVFPSVSTLALGCMGWGAESLRDEAVAGAHAALDAARSCGITLLDHADIYQHGRAEETLGAIFARQPSLRQDLLVQSKCGIRRADATAPGRYDSSVGHVRRSVEDSLRRLHTDYLDILLLHRPDPLMEMDELAALLDQLQRDGKIRAVGVSNMHAAQLADLQRALAQPVVVNQLEMGLCKLDWLEGDTTFNDSQSVGVHPWGGTLSHCRQHGVQLQAWRPLCRGWLSGAAIPSHAPAAVPATAALVARLASDHGLSGEAIVLAWLLRHPARIQPVIGTINPDRIRACAQALSVTLSRDEWYSLYVTARGRPLP